MLTHAAQKLLNTMESTKEPVVTTQEGVDAKLIAIHEEYLDNTPNVNWKEIGVIDHLDTWQADPQVIIL